MSNRMLLQIPTDLISDKKLSTGAKALYLSLVATGPCSIEELAEASQTSRETVRKTLKSLVIAGWACTGGSRHRRLVTPSRPEATQRKLATHLRETRSLLHPVGESLFKMILDVEVADDHYIDNARVPFIQSPKTGEYLELDRWYYDKRVGGEYEGSPHYMVTNMTDQTKLQEIQERDAVKIETCRAKGIPLMIICEDDLSIDGIAKKLPPELPRAHFDSNDLYIRTLDQLCEEYVATCKRARLREIREREVREREAREQESREEAST